MQLYGCADNELQVCKDAEAETPILWPSHAKSWLIGKDPDAGRDWGQEEKGTTEDEMAGWHHQLDGHEFEWTLGVCDGQGGLVCCNSWGCKESDTTERLNWTELILCFVKTMCNIHKIFLSFLGIQIISIKQYSHCWTANMTNHIQNFFIKNWKSVSLKVLISPPPCPPTTPQASGDYCSTILLNLTFVSTS